MRDERVEDHKDGRQIGHHENVRLIGSLPRTAPSIMEYGTGE
jgi:hypothetical protein